MAKFYGKRFFFDFTQIVKPTASSVQEAEWLWELMRFWRGEIINFSCHFCAGQLPVPIMVSRLLIVLLLLLLNLKEFLRTLDHVCSHFIMWLFCSCSWCICKLKSWITSFPKKIRMEGLVHKKLFFTALIQIIIQSVWFKSKEMKNNGLRCWEKRQSIPQNSFICFYYIFRFSFLLFCKIDNQQ